MRLVSWNVNGLRAAHKKGFLAWLDQARPDVLGLQETKCQPVQLPPELRAPPGYHTFWASAEKKGYSGVALFTRREPRRVQVGLGRPEFDAEGRTLIAEFDDFVLINAYFPNGGRSHARVPFKMAYKAHFLDACQNLRQTGRPLLFCGDVNTAHHPIDLARPRQNRQTTGFLPEERVWLDQVVAAGYRDTFRALYPTRSGAYSWWSYISQARARNIGWRLDYFFACPRAWPRVIDAAIHPEVHGSDHCPVSVTLADG